MSATTQLTQYAPAAASLFNNMKLPATILAGAMVPLGFLAPLPPAPSSDDKKTRPENKLISSLRRLHVLVAVASLSSELISIMWATVAVNKLTETVVAPAESVWALLARDYELSWMAVNAHFLCGMLGFMVMIGFRSFLLAATYSSALGMAAACTSASGLLLIISVVNHGVASGGGEPGLRYGATVLSLFRRYYSLLIKGAMSADSYAPLRVVSALLAAAAASLGTWAVFFSDRNDASNEGKVS